MKSLLVKLIPKFKEKIKIEVEIDALSVFKNYIITKVSKPTDAVLEYNDLKIKSCEYKDGFLIITLGLK